MRTISNSPFFKFNVLALSLGLLGSCGGSEQDQGSASVPSTAGTAAIKGLAIDGHLARAKVYIDSDNNGVRDAWEPSAFTDNEGYFSFNPHSQKNYCAANASAEEAQYCLNANRQYDNATLRISGGYDTLTGEPFKGQLSLRLKDVGENHVISPLSSLTSALSPTQATALRSKLKINLSEEEEDYTPKDRNTNGELLNRAIKLHKVVALLSEKITGIYTALGDENGLPVDATNILYEALAKALSNYSGTMEDALVDENLLKNVAIAAELAIQKRYAEKELPLPAQSSDASKFDVIVGRVQELTPLIDELIPPIKELPAVDARAGARAVEVLGSKAANEKLKDPATDRAFTFFRENIGTGVLQVLGDPQADIIQLTEHIFTEENISNPASIQTIGQVAPQATPFTRLSGKQLRVADMDLGQKPNNLKDIEFELYFAGAADATAGSFTACAKYVKKAKADGSLGKGNTRGELVKGYWSLMDSQNITNNYSLLLTFEFLGANYQAIMKSVGTRSIEGTSYQALRFDNNDEYRIWYSANGLEAQSLVPTSSSQCQGRLPSRVGI